MPVIFQSKVGQVVQLNDPVAQCTTSRPLMAVDPTLDWNSYRGIITRITLSQQVNIQFLHTLGSMVYVYVFGDRMGSVTLSGLSFFLCSCDADGTAAASDYQNDVYAWYKTNRASVRSSPIKVSIGEAVVQGFVTGFTEDVVDPALNLVQWGVNMTALPGQS
jgi:hypothetical protein